MIIQVSTSLNALPLVFALGINPTIWQYATRGNLRYDLKANELMYKSPGYMPNNKSDTYGYPNLGHPSDHFNITPFEAIYADPQTYEHIKMQKSAGNNQTMNDYLVYCRSFIIDEIQHDDVCLQNQIIGKNHTQSDPNYKYKAQYTAYHSISAGNFVSPKTDPGDYQTEANAKVHLQAGDYVHLFPGTHFKSGSEIHVNINYTDCVGSNTSAFTPSNEAVKSDENRLQSPQDYMDIPASKSLIYPNPNNGEELTIESQQTIRALLIYDLSGKIVFESKLINDSQSIKIYPNLIKGVYILHTLFANTVESHKIIVQ